MLYELAANWNAAMINQEFLLRVGGVLHLGILIAGILMPQVLDWRGQLKQLSALSRHVIWVHGAFVMLVIVGFGCVSLFEAPRLADGSPLARSVCGFIAVFWLARLAIQFFLFDARPYLNNLVLKLGYRGLTIAFAYFTVVYGLTALR